MVLRTWGDVVVESLMQSWAAVGNFIPLFIGAVVVFLIGWVVAVALGSLIEQVVKALRIDAILQRMELEKALERGGVRLNSGMFLGALVRWFVIIVFLLAAANILGLTQVSEFLTQVLYYIPNGVVAALLQLGVATILIQTLVTGLVAMLAIAFGLAFGLGGKDAASSFIDKVRRGRSRRGERHLIFV